MAGFNSYTTRVDPAKTEAARQRRVAAGAKRAVRTEWFINEVVAKARLTTEQRVRLVTEMVKNEVIRNISVPVVKVVRQTGERRWRVTVDPTSRSKPGEFPRADTTQLMKTIFSDYRHIGIGIFEGYVGTPLDYGLILETKRDRSFLFRTLNENRQLFISIIQKPL